MHMIGQFVKCKHQSNALPAAGKYAGMKLKISCCDRVNASQTDKEL